jgi:hypothetical protein
MARGVRNSVLLFSGALTGSSLSVGCSTVPDGAATNGGRTTSIEGLPSGGERSASLALDHLCDLTRTAYDANDMLTLYDLAEHSPRVLLPYLGDSRRTLQTSGSVFSHLRHLDLPVWKLVDIVLGNTYGGRYPPLHQTMEEAAAFWGGFEFATSAGR